MATAEFLFPLMVTSPISGFYLAASRDGRQVFVMGHSEYDRMTLSDEYYRDLEKGLPIEIPYHYFPEDNLQKAPLYLWRAHGNLLYRNWLNWVYQMTPYDLDLIPQTIRQLHADAAPGAPAFFFARFSPRPGGFPPGRWGRLHRSW